VLGVGGVVGVDDELEDRVDNVLKGDSEEDFEVVDDDFSGVDNKTSVLLLLFILSILF